MTGMEQMVQMLCKWMGLDMQVLGPQVIQTMNKINEAEEKLDGIERMCKQILYNQQVEYNKHYDNSIIGLSRPRTADDD